MSEPLLRLSSVSFHYDPARPVLREVDFALCSGQRVALVGPNGGGKTTLLHLAVGLLQPTGGAVEAFGRSRSCEADFTEVRRRVGLLFQDADDQLFCPTVLEDVAFGPLNLGRPKDEVRQVVARTLSALGLEGYEQRITYRLSEGEKRLVALATVLAMEPEVLLLDEPTGGLDEPHVARLVEILQALPQAMVLVSHDRPFLSALSTEAARIEGGRLEPGTLDEAI